MSLISTPVNPTRDIFCHKFNNIFEQVADPKKYDQKVKKVSLDCFQAIYKETSGMQGFHNIF